MVDRIVGAKYGLVGRWTIQIGDNQKEKIGNLIPANLTGFLNNNFCASLRINATVSKIDEAVAILHEMQTLTSLAMSNYEDKKYSNKEGRGGATKVGEEKNKGIKQTAKTESRTASPDVPEKFTDDVYQKYRQAFNKPNMPLLNTSLNFSQDGRELVVYSADNSPESLISFQEPLSIEPQALLINQLNNKLIKDLPKAFESHKNDWFEADATVLRQDRFMKVMSNHNLEAYGFKAGGNLEDFNKAVRLLREDLGVLLTSNGGISVKMLKQLKETLVIMTGVLPKDTNISANKAVDALLSYCIRNALKANSLPTTPAVESFSQGNLQAQSRTESNIDLLKNINNQLKLPEMTEISFKDAVGEVFKSIAKPLTDREGKYQTNFKDNTFASHHEQEVSTELQKYKGVETQAKLQQLVKTLAIKEEYQGFDKLKATAVDMNRLEVKVMYFQPPVKKGDNLASNPAYPVILIGGNDSSGKFKYLDPLSGRTYLGTTKNGVWKQFAQDNEFPSYGVLSYENENKQLISTNIENTTWRRITDSNALIGLSAMVTNCIPIMQPVSAGLFSLSVAISATKLTQDAMNGKHKSNLEWLGEMINVGTSATLLGSSFTKGLMISNLIRAGEYSTEEIRAMAFNVIGKINKASEQVMNGMIATDGLKALAERNPETFLSLAQNLMLIAGAKIMNYKMISNETNAKTKAMIELGYELKNGESHLAFLKRIESTMNKELKAQIGNLQNDLKKLHEVKQKYEKQIKENKGIEQRLEIQNQLKSVENEIQETKKVLENTITAHVERVTEGSPAVEDDNLPDPIVDIKPKESAFKPEPDKHENNDYQSKIAQASLENEKPQAGQPIQTQPRDQTPIKEAVPRHKQLVGKDLIKYKRMDKEFGNISQNELYNLILQKRIKGIKEFVQQRSEKRLDRFGKQRDYLFEKLKLNEAHIIHKENKQNQGEIVDLMSLKKQRDAYRNMILEIDQVTDLVTYYEQKYEQLIVENVINMNPHYTLDFPKNKEVDFVDNTGNVVKGIIKNYDRADILFVLELPNDKVEKVSYKDLKLMQTPEGRAELSKNNSFKQAEENNIKQLIISRSSVTLEKGFEYINDPKVSPATKATLKEVATRPVSQIEIDGYKFHVSKIIDHAGEQECFVYAEKNKRIEVFRYYKSGSEGGWRLDAPSNYYNPEYPHYNKGRVREFNLGDPRYNGGRAQYVSSTKETKPHPFIETLINNSGQSISINTEVHNKICSLYHKEQAKETYNKLIKDFRPDTEEVHLFLKMLNQEVAGGQFKNKRDLNPYNLLKLKNQEIYPTGFVPDFSKEPLFEYQGYYSNLGSIKVEVYKGVLDGKKIEWHMASDREGSVWVDRFVIEGSKLTKYGVYDVVFPGGPFDIKAMDYLQQIPPQFDKNLTYNPKIHGRYRGISSVLDDFWPIKSYRQSRNIYSSPDNLQIKEKHG